MSQRIHPLGTNWTKMPILVVIKSPREPSDDLRHSSESLRRKAPLVDESVSPSVGRSVGRFAAVRLKGTRAQTQLLTFCSFTRDSRTNANKQKCCTN